MFSFLRQMNITSRCGNRFREMRLADTGLSGCQIPYLFVLYRSPGLTQEELSKALYINKSNVARQLLSLEKAGYIYRQGLEEDRRVLKVYPTEKALCVRDRIRSVQQEWMQILTEDFTQEECEQLTSLMNRIAAKAETLMKEGDINASCR